VLRCRLEAIRLKGQIGHFGVPEQEDDLVMELGWIEKYNVSLNPSRSEITLNRLVRMTVSIRVVEKDKSIYETSATVLKAWSAGLQKQRT